MQLLLGISVRKVYHSILQHGYLLSVSLFNDRAVASMMRVTTPSLILSLYTLNMLRITIPLRINTLIFLSSLFFVRTFVKFNLRQVYVRSCVLVLLRFGGAANADSAVLSYFAAVVGLSWRRESGDGVGGVGARDELFVVLNPIQRIHCASSRIFFLINKFATFPSSRCIHVRRWNLTLR